MCHKDPDHYLHKASKEMYNNLPGLLADKNYFMTAVPRPGKPKQFVCYETNIIRNEDEVRIKVEDSVLFSNEDITTRLSEL